VKESDLDAMAKVLLHDLDPIKRLIADTVSAMIANARRTGVPDILTEDSYNIVSQGDPYKKKNQQSHGFISSSPQNRIIEESS
jgi:hypothetical protein